MSTQGDQRLLSTHTHHLGVHIVWSLMPDSLNFSVLEGHYFRVIGFVCVLITLCLSFHVCMFPVCLWGPDLSLGMVRLATAAPDGNSTSSSWCFVARSTARCCSFKGKRLRVNSTLNFMLLMNICRSLTEEQKKRAGTCECCLYSPGIFT